jgi:hypothetical protein
MSLAQGAVKNADGPPDFLMSALLVPQGCEPVELSSRIDFMQFPSLNVTLVHTYSISGNLDVSDSLP